MAENSAGKDPILDFMVVRAPEELTGAAERRRYIHDRVLIKADTGPVNHVPDDPQDPQALQRVSTIGRIVYELVYCSDLQPGPEALATLQQTVLATIRPSQAVCPPEPEPEPEPLPQLLEASPLTLRLEDLAAHAYLSVGDLYYILPDRLEQLAAMRTPLIGELIRIRPLLRRPAGPFDAAKLQARVKAIVGKPLPAVMFDATGHSGAYRAAHRTLFEALYLLYLARRWTTVDLGDIIDGLQILHAVNALAVDELYRVVRGGHAGQADLERIEALGATMPEFAGWDGNSDVAGLPVVATAERLAELLNATPVVHPLLARLFWFRTPFNDIKPIGVGDLKVVKQWLTAYRPGEISHIHNIMKGESRSRKHRRIERSEQVFSLSNARTEETTRDTQSTERFEVKTEAENVVRATLNVTANANLTYNNSAAMITASAGAGFGYTRATEETARTGQNFARDVVAKAVERVQSQTSSQRTITQIFETNERNNQTFDNTEGDDHISGIYRWVDKEYTAQVYNYGKRMMFEFVVPQPAAFWVESKLQAYRNTLDVPQPPFPEPTRKPVELPFTKEQIDEDLFASLRTQYDLRAAPDFPVETKTVTLREAQSRGRQFAEKDITGHDHLRTFDGSLVGAAGYRAAELHIGGYGEFHHRVADNSTAVRLHDRMVWEETLNAYIWPYDLHVAPAEEIVFTGEETTLTISFNNEIKFYDIAVDVRLERLPNTLADWQQLVYDIVQQIEGKRLGEDFEEEQLAYQARLAEYRNRLAQIKAAVLSEIIAGRSDAANKLVIDEEIKKHCLTMLTKEFATGPAGRLAAADTIGLRDVETSSHVLKVTEATKADERTTVGYEFEKRTVAYPAIDIEKTKAKGTVVQFLEQAFEWDRLSYVFYPYFWGEEGDWIELMNREDDADATFTAFLRSGMARVLLAATPAYEDAVLYYLDTGEPWAGGRTPVIGDPLFVSLHDELRDRTDDRGGGTPEGTSWTFTVPTSLVYLHGSENPLPDITAEREAAEGNP